MTQPDRPHVPFLDAPVSPKDLRPAERRRTGGLPWPLALLTCVCLGFGALLALGIFDPVLGSL